ncbi:MAG: efflux RND transporter periplasmic adaptor subunit [Planctomycetales bacterium]|nr:efflux RND transporter periplasmic adaptor subunit [Planctomycetales bacterium]
MNDNTTQPAPLAKSRFAGFWFALRMIEVRLRFIAVLVAIGLTIGYWETLQNYWDRYTKPSVTTASHVDQGTEFYCPMDPSVVRDSLEPNGSIPKCPICGMPLSLRKKGEAMELPPGVVGRVSLSPNRVKMAGIRTSQIGLRPMVRSIRTVGVVAYDESHQSQIVSRFGGYIEKLLVDQTFVEVKQGDALAEIYSPELYTAVQELKIADHVPNSNLAQIAREKVRLLGIEDQEIDAMLRSDNGKYRVVVRSPTSGFVIKKMVQQGATVTPGQTLFEVADLSQVWIEADIYERDLSLIQLGQEIEATVEAYPDQTFSGMVSSIYPELNPVTRTNRVRFEVDNPQRMLRAGMYAAVTLSTPIQQTEPFHTMLASSNTAPADTQTAIAKQAVCPVTGAKLGSMGPPLAVQADGATVYLCCAGCKSAVAKEPHKYVSRMRTVSNEAVLSVPETAVIDTGEQKIVYVEREAGVYEGVEVQLGPKSNGYYAVISGLLPGDQVAAAGAFLIDAETRLNPAASASYFGASDGPATHDTSGFQKPSSALPTNTDTSDASKLNFQTSRLTESHLAEIAKLPVDDQVLAKLQVLCPVTEQPLGSMGKPLKVVVDDDAVMVCCKACIGAVKKNADRILTTVHRWREANQ